LRQCDNGPDPVGNIESDNQDKHNGGSFQNAFSYIMLFITGYSLMVDDNDGTNQADISQQRVILACPAAAGANNCPVCGFNTQKQEEGTNKVGKLRLVRPHGSYFFRMNYQILMFDF
jgi:hypothetical protein